MKIKKSQFKALIKECLVEILQEGLGDVLNKSPMPIEPEEVENDFDDSSEETSENDFENNEEEFEETSEEDIEEEEDSSEEEETSEEDIEEEEVQETFKRKNKIVESKKRNLVAKKKPVLQKNERLDMLTSMVSGGIKGSDKKKSLFESMFRDTAKTTLQEQTERGAVASANAFKKANIIEANPEEIFDGADRWSKLAFERPKTHTGIMKMK